MHTMKTASSEPFQGANGPSFAPLLRTAAVVSVVALASVFALPCRNAHAQSTDTPWQKLTPSQLTAVDWKWLFSVPAAQSPVLDSTGANAYNGQPYANTGLVLLAGTFALDQVASGDVIGQVVRGISVKQGTALFFPVIDAEWDNIGCTPHLAPSVGCLNSNSKPVGFPQLQASATQSMNNASNLSATVAPADNNFNATSGAKNLTISRLSSPPFSYTLPAQGNIDQSIGVNVSGTIAPAGGDGYFVFIPGDALTSAQGYYLLHWGGRLPISTQGPNCLNPVCYFIQDITYHVTVTP